MQFYFLDRLKSHPSRKFRHVTVFDPTTSSIATYNRSHLASFSFQKVRFVINLNKQPRGYRPSRDADLHIGRIPQPHKGEYFFLSSGSAAYPYIIWDDNDHSDDGSDKKDGEAKKESNNRKAGNHDGNRKVPWADIVIRNTRVFRLPCPTTPDSTFDRVEGWFRPGLIVIYVAHDPTPNADEHTWTKLEEVCVPQDIAMSMKENAANARAGKNLWAGNTLEEYKRMHTDAAVMARVEQQTGLDLLVDEKTRRYMERKTGKETIWKRWRSENSGAYDGIGPSRPRPESRVTSRASSHANREREGSTTTLSRADSGVGLSARDSPAADASPFRDGGVRAIRNGIKRCVAAAGGLVMKSAAGSLDQDDVEMAPLVGTVRDV